MVVESDSPPALPAPEPAQAAITAIFPTHPPAGTEPRAGPLPTDHVVRCACGGGALGGVCASSRERATRPTGRPRVAAYRPAPELQTLVLPPGGALSAGRLEALKADVLGLRPDDVVVLKGGCGPDWVRLLDTRYRTCRRARMGLRQLCTQPTGYGSNRGINLKLYLRNTKLKNNEDPCNGLNRACEY